MRHAARTALIALALIAPALAAAALPVRAQEAQEEPATRQEEGQDEAPQQDDAEIAFLRAYYLEVGKQDHEAALAAYRKLLADHPDSAMAVRALLGQARNMQALGAYEEARVLLGRIVKEVEGDEKTLAVAERMLAVIAARSDGDGAGRAGDGGDVDALVLRALRGENWRQRAPSFGEMAVPAFARLLRSVDPEISGRAAFALLWIGTDAACDSLAEALTAKDVQHQGAITSIGLGAGPFPARLGTAIATIPDTEMRDRLVRSALYSSSAQPWLVDLVLREDWARAVAFPPEPVKSRGIGWLTEAVIAAGPGPARDAAVAHMMLYAPKPSGDRVPAPSAFIHPSAAFLADREALRVAAVHVFTGGSFRTPPSPELRDALLADEETRELALNWTWRYRMPCDDRALLLESLTGDWHVPSRTDWKNSVANVLRASFDPPPTREEWARVLAGTSWLPATIFSVFDDPEPVLSAALDVGSPSGVVDWVARRGVPSPDWALRALPPLLADADVGTRAARVLVRLQADGTVDVSSHAADFVALLRRDALWENSPDGRLIVTALLTQMGDGARDALVAAVPLGNVGDGHVLAIASDAGAPEGAEVARRLMLTAGESDDDPRLSLVGDATQRLLQTAGDASVPDLLRALRTGPPKRALWVADAVWRSCERNLSSRAFETFLSALMDDLPAGVEFRRSPGSLDTAAARRLSLRALRSENVVLQVWGAERQRALLDPDAAARLGVLAESPEPRVRGAARQTLAAMRKADADMAWMRAVAARRATRGKVDVYLASADANQRMAGVAGLVALRAPDAVERLLDVAANDGDAAVRAEARRALLALGAGRSAVTLVQAAGGKDDGR